ncbi:CinA family protein [Maridesulfovibrio bastinii]|jgi:nicotinamide-nucleotide amidase|uniref:CinA family protein n=1 Tax=Maridesulfovibrio bastinii TaxID=47157 RepID=UPI00041352C9|nr:CinA family protein [Maridesulfovibrio bastinii]
MEKLVSEIGELLVSKGWTMSTAESCTGGLVAATLTDVSGSSRWFSGAIVAYSNEIKMAMLDVSEKTLIDHGAVSEETVLEMADGVSKKLGTQVGISLSGVAGPTGGSAEKPVGTVWMGWHIGDKTFARKCLFSGDRAAVKKQSLEYVLETLRDQLL